jgi:hypothetical protein
MATVDYTSVFLIVASEYGEPKIVTFRYSLEDADAFIQIYNLNRSEDLASVEELRYI